MQKSLARFIEQIHHYPDYLLETQLKNLLEDKDVKSLKELSFLKQGSDLKEILCKSCDDDHFLLIKVDNGKPYYLCSQEDTGRNYLCPEEISTWKVDIEALLQQLSLKLNIETSIEKMQVEGLWQIGGFSKDDTRHDCYYYQGKNFQEVLDFIKQLPSTLKRYVIFTAKQETSTLESAHELLLLGLKDLMSLKTKLTFNEKLFNEFLIHGFRSVIFQTKNGDLIVNGQTIANVTPSTPEYCFVELLWKNFNEPVSHQKIKAYIYKKTGKEYEDDSQKLSHKQKSKVKTDSKNPSLIDEIFQTTKDFAEENAYIMKNPA